jgi:asparagine synthase (glutamine-hydrolysing)
VCGIAGCFARSSRDEVAPAVVDAMAVALAHRGPNGAGSFAWPATRPRVAMAMRRLAILDLDTGDQPVRSEDGSITAVANGEIYNFVELAMSLRARGHVLRSTGDTETLVHLYEEHGLEVFSHLRGMYAFALWDAPRERLVLAVDHAGIKPLYLHEGGGRLRFASEIRGLLADPDVPRRLRTDALDTYCTFGYMIGEDTLVDGITRVAPGTAIVAERGGMRVVRHGAPFTSARAPRRVESHEAATIVRDALADAVRVHLRSDVPVGLFLSGGVDSAGILAMVRTEGREIRTFTVGYQGDAGRRDERTAAAAAARWAGAAHRELRLTASDWWRAIPLSVAADEPIANPAMVTLHALAAETSRDVRVVLNGTGGDELFGGYETHALLAGFFARTESRPRARGGRFVGPFIRSIEPWYPRLRRWPWFARLPRRFSLAGARRLPRDDGLRRVASFEWLAMTDAERRRSYAGELEAAWRTGHAARAFAALVDDAGSAGPTAMDRAQALIMRTWLPGNGLLALDKVTMAHGLEARVPYFDRTLMARVLETDAATRLQARKGLLHGALAHDLPAPLRARAKQPFETPIGRWLDRDLAPAMRDVLLDPGARIRRLFRRGALERMVNGQVARRLDRAELLFRFVVLELWWRACLER